MEDAHVLITLDGTLYIMPIQTKMLAVQAKEQDLPILLALLPHRNLVRETF